MRPEEESQGPVIRDRRRIDPVTGQVRDTGEPGPRRGPASAGAQPRPGRHSVSRPGGSSATGSQTSAEAARGTAEASGSPDGQPDRAASGAASATAGREATGAAAEAAAAKATMMLSERTADLQRLQAEYANYRKRVERDRLAVREQALANVLNELVPVLDDIGRAREHGELTGGFKSVGESLEGIAVKLGLTSFGEAGDPFDPTLHDALMHSYSADVTEPTAVQILQPGYKVGERIIRPARVAVAEPGGDAPDGTPSSTVEASTVEASTVEASTVDASTGEAGAAQSGGMRDSGDARDGSDTRESGDASAGDGTGQR
jgi:molecular chaperone GrpE